MAKKNVKKVPKTFLGRASILLTASASVIGREVGSSLASKLSQRPEFAKLQTRMKQTQDLVDALSNLKGAAMKAGQLLSIEMSDLLPPEVVKILRTLHDEATFMPIADVKKILRKELGAGRRDKRESVLSRITELSDEPIASASIGQVHKAKVDGQDVVIKIQYPGVGESIDSDLSVLKRIVSLFLNMRMKKVNLDGVFAELSDGLKMEVDYRLELENLKKYRAAFRDLPQYIVPEVYPEFSTDKVLTMSFETGIKLNEWLKEIRTDEARAELGQIVLDLLHYEFFAKGIMQTDPNYGNFLMQRHENKLRLVLLDFGAVRTYAPTFRHDVRELLSQAMLGNKSQMLLLAERFGLLDTREPDDVKQHFFDLMATIVFMFRPENQPFNYADAEYLKNIRSSTMNFANMVHYTSPAKHMIFLNRKLGGMYHLLKDANCKIDVYEFWKRAERLDLQAT